MSKKIVWGPNPCDFLEVVTGTLEVDEDELFRERSAGLFDRSKSVCQRLTGTPKQVDVANVRDRRKVVQGIADGKLVDSGNQVVEALACDG